MVCRPSCGCHGIADLNYPFGILFVDRSDVEPQVLIAHDLFPFFLGQQVDRFPRNHGRHGAGGGPNAIRCPTSCCGSHPPIVWA